MIHQRRKFDLVEKQLDGSGGWIIADITEEQAKNADLGVGKLFIAKVEKLDLEKIRTQALEKVAQMETLDETQRSMKLLDVMSKAVLQDAKNN